MEIEERERIAKAASPGPWQVSKECPEFVVMKDKTAYQDERLWHEHERGKRVEANATHIAASDPSWVLRVCEFVQAWDDQCRSVSHRCGEKEELRPWPCQARLMEARRRLDA